MISLGRFIVETNQLKILPDSPLRHLVISALMPHYIQLQREALWG